MGTDGISPAQLHAEYSAQEEIYRATASEYRLRIDRVLEANDIQAALTEARHKKPLALFKKQRRKNYLNPWSDCPDLVGARIVIPLSTDKARVVGAVSSSEEFTSVTVEDQTVGADPDEIAYRGLHLHLLSDQVNADGIPIRCELQVRTVAEHSWAMTEHDYVYKKAQGLPYAIQRTFGRLLVLVELYDLELARGVEMVRGEPSYAEVSFVLRLEEQFEQLTGQVGDQETTREIVAMLGASMSMAPADLRTSVDRYLASNASTVTTFLANHGPDSSGFDVTTGWIASQPELLLILAMLDTDEYALSNALAESDLYSYVEPIAMWTDHAGFLR